MNNPVSIRTMNVITNIVNLIAVEVDNTDWSRCWEYETERILKNAVSHALSTEYGKTVEVATDSGACRSVAIPNLDEFPFVIKVDTPRGLARLYGGCEDEVRCYERANDAEREYLAEAFGYKVYTDEGVELFIEFQEKLCGGWEPYFDDSYLLDADDWEPYYGGLHRLCDRLGDLHTGNFMVTEFGDVKLIDYACRA